MDYDIAVIGAGPAGLSFALSLRGAGLKVAVVEKQAESELANPAYDGREIALTHLSKKIMQAHGSWQQLDADDIAPLKNASVVDGDSPHTLRFESSASSDEPLGFLVANNNIRKATFAAFEKTNHATLMADTLVKHVSTDDRSATIALANGDKITSELVVAADTRFSQSRSQMGIPTEMNDYGRSAILCVMEHEKSHQQTALECFLYGGTLAVLPLNHQQSSMVITIDSSQVSKLLSMGEVAFNQMIEERLNGQLGKMKQVGTRYHYPLVGVHAKRFYSKRFVLVGDAAVGMHPVTAHGFNLGLSGQDLLAKAIIKANKNNKAIWDNTVLAQYQRQHMLNSRVLYHGTNGIVGLFTRESPTAKLLRKAVLRVSHLPPIKQAIKYKLMTKHHHPFARLPGR